MTQEEKRECKKYIIKAKQWYKQFGRNHGAVAFVESGYNVISTLEIAIRYLVTKGYHFNFSYGTNRVFRDCYISIS